MQLQLKLPSPKTCYGLPGEAQLKQAPWPPAVRAASVSDMLILDQAIFQQLFMWRGQGTVTTISRASHPTPPSLGVVPSREGHDGIWPSFRAVLDLG